MKKVIKIIIAMLVIVTLLFGSVAGLKVIRRKNAKKVQVYSVSDVVVSPDFFFEDSMSYGEIGSDKVQSVFISDSQKVKEILVQEGEEVKRGDVLMTYDTTLTALQLERAENDLRQEEYNLQKAEEDLEIINKLVPVSEDSNDYDSGYDDYDDYDNYDDFADESDLDDLEPIDDTAEDEKDKENDKEDDEEEKDYEPQETGVLLYGSGTADEPYVYLWDLEDKLTDERMLAMFAPHISPSNPDDDSYEDSYDGDYDDTSDYSYIEDTDEGGGLEDGSIGQSGNDELIDKTLNGDEFLDTPANSNDVVVTDEEIQDSATEEISGARNSFEVEFADPEVRDEYIESETVTDTVFEEHEPENNGKEVESNSDENMDDQRIQDSDGNNEISDDNQEINEGNSENEIYEPAGIDNSDIYAVVDNIEFGTEADPNGNQNHTQTNNTQNTVTPQNNTVPEYLNDAPADLYVVLEVHKDNNMDAPLMQSFGLHLIRDGIKVTIQLFNPNEENNEENDEEGEGDEEDGDEKDSEQEDAESDAETTDEYGDEADDFDNYDDYDEGGDYYDDSYDDSDESGEEDEYANSRVNPNGKYTEKEIEELRKETEKDIRDLTISVKKANIALMEQQNEYASNVVKSKIDGVVKTVREPAEDMSDAVIVITSGGGYTVTVNIGELEMMNIEQGQEVKVSSVSNEDETYSGYVQEIGNYPTSDSDSFGSGNPFVSYYPCKILIDENAEFREGDYLGVSFDTGKEKKGLYIESMFVRSDSKGKYVYVRGEDGKLERRNIRTGKSPDQYTVEVRGGLSKKDYIAFPYGTNVFEGAETEEATIDELYA